MTSEEKNALGQIADAINRFPASNEIERLEAVNKLCEKLEQIWFSLSGFAERRRYALLQAAATMMEFSDTFENEIKISVDYAEGLLAEIVKREKAEAES